MARSGQIRRKSFFSVASSTSSLLAVQIITTFSNPWNTSPSSATSPGWLFLLPLALAKGAVEVDAQDVVDGTYMYDGNNEGDVPCYFCPPGFSFQHAESCSNPFSFTSSKEKCDALRMAFLKNLTFDCGYCVPNNPKRIQRIIKRRGLCTLCKNGTVPQKDANFLPFERTSESCGERANRIIVLSNAGDNSVCVPKKRKGKMKGVAELCGCVQKKKKGKEKVPIDENGECPEGMNICKNRPKLCCQGGNKNNGGTPFDNCLMVPETADNIFAVGRKNNQKECPTLVDIFVELYNSGNYTAQSVLGGDDAAPRIAIETALANVWVTKYGGVMTNVPVREYIGNIDGAEYSITPIVNHTDISNYPPFQSSQLANMTAEDMMVMNSTSRNSKLGNAFDPINVSGRRLAAALDLELASGPIVYKGFDFPCPSDVPATSESGAAYTCHNFTASLGVIPSFIGNKTTTSDLTPEEITGDVVATFNEAKADGNLTKALSEVEGGAIWSVVGSVLEKNETGNGDGIGDNSTIAPTNTTETSSPVPTPSPTVAPTIRDTFMESVVEADVEIGLYNSENHTAQDVVDGTATPPGSSSSYKSVIEAALGFVWPIKYPSAGRLDLELVEDAGLKPIDIASGIDVACPDYVPANRISGGANQCQNLTARFLVRAAGNETYPEKNVSRDVNAAYQEAQRDGNLTEQFIEVGIWKVFRVQGAWEFNAAGNGGAPGTSTKSSDSGSSTNVGAIIGGVVGGIVLLTCGLGALVLCRKRSNKVDDEGDVEHAKPGAENWNNNEDTVYADKL